MMKKKHWLNNGASDEKDQIDGDTLNNIFNMKIFQHKLACSVSSEQ